MIVEIRYLMVNKYVSGLIEKKLWNSSLTITLSNILFFNVFFSVIRQNKLKFCIFFFNFFSYFPNNFHFKWPKIIVYNMYNNLFSGARITQSLIFCVVFLSFFNWPLHCLSFLALRLLQTLLNIIVYKCWANLNLQ